MEREKEGTPFRTPSHLILRLLFSSSCNAEVPVFESILLKVRTIAAYAARFHRAFQAFAGTAEEPRIPFKIGWTSATDTLACIYLVVWNLHSNHSFLLLLFASEIVSRPRSS